MEETEIGKAERLDQYVARQLSGLSRAAASKLISEGQVKVNDQTQTKPGYRLRFTDNVTINYNPPKHSDLPKIELPILYEDDDCVVVNKPAGLLTHSKGAFNPEATVATWLASRIKGMEGERAGIVHRLDRATSGVLIGAKNPEALSWLQKQFSQRKVKKTYAAIVQGSPKQPEAIIDMPIERNPKKPQTFRVGSNGKAATTDYKVLAAGNGYSQVELKPHTGRTHQLRVHMEQLGHPIVGDELYGGKKADRLYLHAESLELTLPNRTRKTFKVPLPAEFSKLLSK